MQEAPDTPVQLDATQQQDPEQHVIQMDQEQPTVEQHEQPQQQSQQQQPQPQVQPTIEQIQAEQAALPLNFWSEVQQGNFGLILNFPVSDINALDFAGYSLLHNAVSYNILEGVKLLLKRGACVDVRSKFDQTPLVIACNYGYIEIAKLLIAHDAQIDVVDSYQFSPLLYALKQKHYALTMWLVCRGASIHNLKDNNGCSSVHWAAYYNDVFTLRFLKAVGVKINLLDNLGFTPLVRACHNYGYEAVNFICQNYPDMLQYGCQPGESVTLKKKIKTQLLKLKLSQHPLGQSIIAAYGKWYHTFLSTLYLLLTTSMIYGITFASGFQTLQQTQFWFIASLIYVIGILYFALCSIWFINKTTNTPEQGRRLVDRPKKNVVEEEKVTADPYSPLPETYSPLPEAPTEESIEIKDVPSEQKSKRVSWYQFQVSPPFLQGVTIKEFLQVNYKSVEDFIDQMLHIPKDYMKFASNIHEHQDEIKKIVEIDDPLWYESFTIMHIVFFLFETNRFNALHAIDWDRVCSTCLMYKPPRTYHCSLSGRCVKDYNYRSWLFGKSINSTNHLIYVLFQTLQLIMLAIYVFFFYLFYAHLCQLWFIFYPLEILNIILHQDGTIILLIYIIVACSYVVQLLMWLVEVYCIVLNMTYTELMCSARYRYLYKPQNIKNGKAYLCWRPRIPYGPVYNVVMYLSNQIKTIRLV